MWYNLISDEDRGNTEFIYSLSYGKDSFAGFHVTIDILGIPVHRIVHAEVWATDTIPADLPPMVEFKAKADAYIKARWGLTVEHICATRDGERLTYEKLFYHVPERKNPNRGGAPDGPISRDHGATASSKCVSIWGFPTKWTPWCNSDLKRAALRLSHQQSQRRELVHPTQDKAFSQSPRRRGAKRNIVHILGIAADEPERVARYIDKPGYLLPLVEADWHEDLCGLWCQYEGTLSPVYENACRSGCWFCHNQGVDQLRILWRDYPDHWALLMKWDLDSPVTFKAYGHTVHDFDKRFRMEQQKLIPMDRTFRWEMLEKPPKFVAMTGEQISLFRRKL